jgi:hypothetical protein
MHVQVVCGRSNRRCPQRRCKGCALASTLCAWLKMAWALCMWGRVSARGRGGGVQGQVMYLRASLWNWRNSSSSKKTKAAKKSFTHLAAPWLARLKWLIRALGMHICGQGSGLLGGVLALGAWGEGVLSSHIDKMSPGWVVPCCRVCSQLCVLQYQQ